MSREKEFAKNTVVLAIGRYLPKLFALITIPIVTATLTKDEYGTYDLICTLVSLLLPIITLQIQSAAFRFLIDCRGDKKESGKIISNIFFFTLITTLITIVIFFFIYNKVSIITRVLICMYFCTDILYLLLGQVARGLGNNSIYSVSAFVVSLTNASLVVLTLKVADLGLNGILFSYLFGQLIACIYIAKKINVLSYIHIKDCSKDMLKKLLSYSWPMVPNNLSNWVLKISDRIIITSVCGVEANAVYAVANKIPYLLSDAQSVMVMGWQENASIAAKDKDSSEYYSEMFRTMFKMVISVTGALVAATPIMFELLIKGDYDEAYYEMPILTIGMFFYCMSAFLGGIYVAYKNTKKVALTTVMAAAINVVVNLLLVKRIGIRAGSVSTLVAYLVLFGYRMFDVNKIKKIKYNYIEIIGLTIILLGMNYLTFQRNLYLDIINVVIAVILMFTCNRALISKICKRIFCKSK
ncbi:MAG: oligosaccharide flippase family protein [Lachnospiraceae bacterium]|nr:oligosaccharide flippase family protein [Lachnospiraceae bacterium]